MSNRTDRLFAELSAICSWDDAYYSEDFHDFVATAAWEARQQRLPELLKELRNPGILRPQCVMCFLDRNRRRIRG